MQNSDTQIQTFFYFYAPGYLAIINLSIIILYPEFYTETYTKRLYLKEDVEGVKMPKKVMKKESCPLGHPRGSQWNEVSPYVMFYGYFYSAFHRRLFRGALSVTVR